MSTPADGQPAIAEASSVAVAGQQSAPTTVTLHLPSQKALNSDVGADVSAHPPSADWMAGTWHVTHSTLPMWKGKANVRITYTPLPNSHAAGEAAAPAFDDLVEYQSQGSSKVSTVHGVSKPIQVDGYKHSGWAYQWRGKGWLMIASSHWELLGWGHEQSSKSEGLVAETGKPKAGWAVTYFSKTLFTPAGLDIYCRDGVGVSDATFEEIKTKLSSLGHDTLTQLSGQLFAIPRE